MKKELLLGITISLLFFSSILAQAQKPTLESPSSDATQNKISLDIKGMDIVDVLKMLATRAGLNLVVGKNVTGKVTVFLKDVKIWDAFEIILLANDMAYERKDEIINVMTQRDYELQYGERYRDRKQAKIVQLKYARASDLSRALTQIKSNIGRIVTDEASNIVILIDTPEKIKEMETFIKNSDLPVKTQIFSLSYAQADKISAKIQETLTKGVGYIRIDERTNKIAVTDYPEKLDEITKIISAFDEKTPQVLIDAQIIEIRPSDKFDMGVDWDYWIKKNLKVAASLPLGTGNRLSFGTPSITPTQQGDYKAILELLRTIGDTKILSSPRIMVLNNQEAKIHVGTKDAYITSTTSQSGTGSTTVSQSVNFVDVGIKLFVTPTINKDNFVTMKIKPEISSATRTSLKSEDKVTEVPIVSTSETETTIMVKAGVTIIMGGLRKDERSKTVKKIPLIGDIPGLGFFFRNTSDELKKTELVILLTPHIMSGETSYTDFSQIQPTDGVVFKMSKGEIITEKIVKPVGNKSSADKDVIISSYVGIYEYYKLVMDKVRSMALIFPAIGEKGEVEISFALNANGQLKEEPQIIFSSNQNLNKIVSDCIKNASPFPPFPAALEKKDERFSISLEYK